MTRKFISKNQINRYPIYLNYLKSLSFSNEDFISNKQISNALNINLEVVKKDLAAISSNKGLPRIGRKVIDLIDDIEKFIGIKNTLNAILIGAGHLGKALLNFDEFKSTGLNIVGAFDVNPLLYEIDINGVNVYPMEKIEDFIEKHDVSIAILTIPSSVAQDIVNRLEKTDIKAIWNFAPVNLVSKNDIIIETTLLSQSYANIYHQLILNQKRRGK